MRTKSIKLNATLNVIRSCLSIVFPLITTPYILRVLGSTGVGKVSYVTSIISYFSLFAMLGVSPYGVREGAKRKKDVNDFNSFVSEVFTINLITTFISCISLIIVVFAVDKFHSYHLLFFILGFSIIFQTFSIEWINTVHEDFLYITTRTIVVFIVHMFLIFILIKDVNDYYLYAVLQVLSNGIICFSNWFHCKKYVTFSFKYVRNLTVHLKPLVILFANAVMISIYVNFDTTMLGWFQGDSSVGLYSVSVKIYSVGKSIMVAIYSVVIPRLAKYQGQNENQLFKQLYSRLWSYMPLILLPASTGIICLAREIIIIMGGKKYFDAVLSLQILSGALIFAIFGGMITACLNVIIGREKENLIATILSALINLLLNFYFVPVYSLNGAAFTTLISEAFVFLFCFVRLPDKKQYIEKNIVLRNIMHSIFGSALIICVTLVFKYYINSIFLRLSGITIVSCLIYCLLLYLCKNQLFLYELQNLKTKISRKK